MIRNRSTSLRTAAARRHVAAAVPTAPHNGRPSSPHNGRPSPPPARRRHQGTLRRNHPGGRGPTLLCARRASAQCAPPAMWRAVASIRMPARVDASGRRPVPRPAVGWPGQLPSAARLRRSWKVLRVCSLRPGGERGSGGIRPGTSGGTLSSWRGVSYRSLSSAHVARTLMI